MPKRSKKLKKLGQFFEFNFRLSIGVAAVSAILVFFAALAFAYQWVDREVLKFLATATGAAIAVTSAVYVGDGIRQNLAIKKADRAMSLISAWIDPSFIECNKSARKVRLALAGKPEHTHIDIIKKMIETDPDLEDHLVAILNFLDAVGLAVEEDLVDEDITQEYFRFIFERFCDVFELWIAERRVRSRFVYRSLTDVSGRWKEEKGPATNHRQSSHN